MEDIWIVEIILGIVGITLIGWGMYSLVRALESRKWPTTKGEVVNSVMILNQDGNNLPKYGAVVQYKYTVEGNEYISKRLSFNSGVQTTFRSLAEKEALCYKPGMIVHVYYDPQTPNEAVLIPGADF